MIIYNLEYNVVCNYDEKCVITCKERKPFGTYPDEAEKERRIHIRLWRQNDSEDGLCIGCCDTMEEANDILEDIIFAFCDGEKAVRLIKDKSDKLVVAMLDMDTSKRSTL